VATQVHSSEVTAHLAQARVPVLKAVVA
jgi:hypothetical protein